MTEKRWVPQTMAATFARIVADPGADWLIGWGCTSK